jgi:hypothetical protein
MTPDFTDPGRINAIVDQIIDEHAKNQANHVVRKLTEDETWIACALQRYQDVEHQRERDCWNAE